MNYNEKEAVAKLGQAIKDAGVNDKNVTDALERVVDMANATQQSSPAPEPQQGRTATQDLSAKQGSGAGQRPAERA